MTTPSGRSSVVERQLPKLNVVGSSPIARSILPAARCRFWPGFARDFGTFDFSVFSPRKIGAASSGTKGTPKSARFWSGPFDWSGVSGAATLGLSGTDVAPSGNFASSTVTPRSDPMDAMAVHSRRIPRANPLREPRTDRARTPSAPLRPSAHRSPRDLAVDFPPIHHAVHPYLVGDDFVDDSNVTDTELPVAAKRLAKSRTISVGRHAEPALDSPKDAFAQICGKTPQILRDLGVEPNRVRRSLGHRRPLASGRKACSDIVRGERRRRLPRAPSLVRQPIQRAVLMEFDRLADQVMRHLRQGRALLTGESLHDGEQPWLE